MKIKEKGYFPSTFCVMNLLLFFGQFFYNPTCSALSHVQILLYCSMMLLTASRSTQNIAYQETRQYKNSLAMQLLTCGNPTTIWQTYF